MGIHAEAENAAIQTMAITKNTDLWLGFRDAVSKIEDKERGRDLEKVRK